MGASHSEQNEWFRNILHEVPQYSPARQTPFAFKSQETLAAALNGTEVFGRNSRKPNMAILRELVHSLGRFGNNSQSVTVYWKMFSFLPLE